MYSVLKNKIISQIEKDVAAFTKPKIILNLSTWSMLLLTAEEQQLERKERENVYQCIRPKDVCKSANLNRASFIDT